MPRDKKSDNVRVVVRCRPLNRREVEERYEEIIEVDERAGTLRVTNPDKPGSAPKQYTFDAAYGKDSKQVNVYTESAQPIVDDVLEGFNGTIFAYGQTGTGKTFTMNGERKPGMLGIIPQAFEHIFESISKSTGRQYLVRASFLEIYMENVRDLLTKERAVSLAIREDPDKGVFVENLNSIVVQNAKEINAVMKLGDRNRQVGVTDMNAHSSRSHAVFIVNVECAEDDESGESHIRSGKLNLVDLAGSERQSKTNATGQRAQEARKINLSLTCLGLVIQALVEGKGTGHVPYRNSSLTRLLQDSLGGNSKTMMVATVGPASYNFSETMSTLFFADSAKRIKNKPKINEDPKDTQLRQYQEQIAQLRAQLERQGGGLQPRRRKRKKDKKPKAIRYDTDGNAIEEPDSGSGEEDDDADAGEMDEAELAQLREEERKELESEKEAMLADQTIVKEEKARLLAEMEQREAELRQEAEAAAMLASQIKAMESKLLVGGKAIVVHTAEQERKLLARKKQIEEHNREKARMRERLEEQESKRKEAEESYGSLQHEVDSKTKKLAKIWTKLQDAKKDLETMHEDFTEARERVQSLTEEAQKAVLLKQKIIEHFIPPDVAERLKKRAVYDEESGQWRLLSVAQAADGQSAGVSKRPISAHPGRPRAVTMYATMQAAVDLNPRYKPANIMSVELDMPDRTTMEYEGPMMDARVQAAVNEALEDEGDITVDMPEGDFLEEAMRRARREQKKSRDGKSSRPRTAKVTKTKGRAAAAAAEPNYPKSRGLTK